MRASILLMSTTCAFAQPLHVWHKPSSCTMAAVLLACMHDFIRCIDSVPSSSTESRSSFKYMQVFVFLCIDSALLPPKDGSHHLSTTALVIVCMTMLSWCAWPRIDSALRPLQNNFHHSSIYQSLFVMLCMASSCA
jgi:hypothetical protein